MITYAGESQTHPEERIYYGILTGPHGSGKSTLLEQFADPELTAELGFADGNGSDYNPHYQASLFPIEVAGEQYELPVVTCEEAATRYVKQRQDPKLVTTAYTLGHQVAMEGLAIFMVSEVLPILRSYTRSRPPIAHLGHCGLVLTDRSVLDGHAYSAVRIPDSGTSVDLRDVDAEVMNIESKGQSRPFDRRISFGFVREHADLVFLCDETDIAFKGDELRLPSETFRTKIRERLLADYIEFVPDRYPELLSGSVQERKQTVLEVIAELLDIDNNILRQTAAV